MSKQYSAFEFARTNHVTEDDCKRALVAAKARRSASTDTVFEKRLDT